MKKVLAAVLVFALLLPVLAGCQSAFAKQYTEESRARIPMQQALDIALEDAGLSEQDISDLEIDPDREQGQAHYDVDFEKDGQEYDYEINAETGNISQKEVPAPPVVPETVPAATLGPITRQEAIGIALAHAGLAKDQVRDLDAELDNERGTLLFDVDFESAGYEYEYKIHAETGEILKTEKEWD